VTARLLGIFVGCLIASALGYLIGRLSGVRACARRKGVARHGIPPSKELLHNGIAATILIPANGGSSINHNL
jgi:membrane protein DedA with SNARE-associated domain